MPASRCRLNTTRVASRSDCSLGNAASQSGAGYEPTVVARILGELMVLGGILRAYQPAGYRQAWRRAASLSVPPNCKKLLTIGTLRSRGRRGGKGVAFSGP